MTKIYPGGNPMRSCCVLENGESIVLVESNVVCSVLCARSFKMKSPTSSHTSVPSKLSFVTSNIPSLSSVPPKVCNEMHLCKWVSMRVEGVLGSVLECVPCARVSNQIIVYTSPNYRNKINSATHSESLQGDPLWSRTDFLECMISD